MRRRDFIAGLGAVVWPHVAWAQQPTLPVIGFLSTHTSEAGAGYAVAFRRGLRETGYVEGQNVGIEYRRADDQPDRLPPLATDLVQRRVAVIVATPTSAAVAAKAATSIIPIVFQVGGDPVKEGLVSSMNRPGSNATGVSQLSPTLIGKRLGLLRELIPTARVVGLITDPQARTSEEQARDFQQAALVLGLRPRVLNRRDIDAVFSNPRDRPIDAFVVGAMYYFHSIIDRMTGLAATSKVPVIYESREFTTAGGLLSYGVDFADVYRQLGVYAGKILRGEKPADLPVLQPTKLELMINLKTAKALGLHVPDRLLALADEVIE